MLDSLELWNPMTTWQGVWGPTFVLQEFWGTTQGVGVLMLCLEEEYSAVLGNKVFVGALLHWRDHTHDDWSLGKLIH